MAQATVLASGTTADAVKLSATHAVHAVAFPAAMTLIRIIRSGNSIELYGNGVLLATKTVTFKRLLPAIFRNNSEITVNRFIVR